MKHWREIINVPIKLDFCILGDVRGVQDIEIKEINCIQESKAALHHCSQVAGDIARLLKAGLTAQGSWFYSVSLPTAILR